MKRIFLIISLAIFFCSSCSNEKSGNETFTLAFNFQEGTAYVYSMDTKQTIQQQMGGMISEISQHMQLQSSYKVESAGDNKKLTINYDRFYIQSASNGMVMEYDSKDSSKQPAELASAGNIVNHPFSIVVNSKGEILKVENINAIDNNAANPSQFNDSSIRQMMEQSLNVYPDNPVKKGDTWQRTYNTNVGFMDMTVISNYKLVSVANDVAHIEIKATIKSKPSDNPQMQGMEMEMSGTQTGTMDIDVKTGLIQDSRFVQDVTGKMKIPGTEIPMSLRSDTRIIGRMK